ncbi:hypothetical protein Tco_1449684 [Tanacetum coccineum]
MASSSSTNKTTLNPTINVNFELGKGVIAFNNGVAVLEHKNPLYLSMLSFLKSCCVSTALTKPPSTYYLEYLREFWYTAEVDTTLNSITFSLSSSSQPKYSKPFTTSKSQGIVDETQHAEVLVATANTIQSLDSSKSVEEVANRPQTATIKKVTVLNLGAMQAATLKTSLRESGEDHGHPRPNREYMSTLNLSKYYVHLKSATRNDATRFRPCHTPKRGLDGIRVQRCDVIAYIEQDQVNDHYMNV